MRSDRVSEPQHGPDEHGPWGDLSRFTSLRRTAAIRLSPDGSRLVAVVLEADEARSRWVPSLWEIPLDGGSPYRLPGAPAGAASPVFLPDNSLLYVSGQLWPGDEPVQGTADEPALWLLPVDGPPLPFARRPGGLTAPLAARDSGALIAMGQRLSGSTAENDAARRATRRERRVTAVLQSWMPTRDPFRDHDIEYPQLLFRTSPSDPQWRDLAPDAGKAMVKLNPLTLTERSVSAAGDRIVVMWGTPAPRGGFPYGIALIETGTGARTPIAPGSGRLYTSPQISPDGRRVAAMAITEGTFDTPVAYALHVFDISSPNAIETPAEVTLGDLYPVEWAWSPGSDALYIAGDRHGRGALAAVAVSGPPEPGALVPRYLASDAVYAQLAPSPDGRWIYALRSAVDAHPAPVRLDVTADGQAPVFLGDPAPVPPLPGRLEEVSAATADGGTVRGYLCVPDTATPGAPAPTMQWIHGGPLTSFDGWSWGWNPWVMAARGWAVLLPDPALSTGYGPDWIARAWPHRAAVVWSDIEALLDEAGRRDDIDTQAAACLGASFGGLMTNWIAGHTNRFHAIVTHAGLYALDQHHATTEQAWRKHQWFGTRAQHPRWYAENSPHDAAARITTPMLITHGNLDYNVPVTEALRLWWDLCDGWEGDRVDMPHRLLRFTDEAHFVTRPAHAEIWYGAVLAFCSTHVLGRPTPFPDLIRQG
jgi:dipeptidyl aminopeptidase/acylaminoacyl peptidase